MNSLANGVQPEGRVDLDRGLVGRDVNTMAVLVLASKCRLSGE